MKNAIIAAIVAALVASAGGFAAGTVTSESTQNHQIAQLRATVKHLYIANAYNTFRLDLADCKTDVCRANVTFAYNYSEQWPGWSTVSGR